MFQPELWSCLRSCSRKQLLTDLLAGAVVGVVALPLAMAFAIASGVAPEKGLYTAIVAGFLISALGGSRGDAIRGPLENSTTPDQLPHQPFQRRRRRGRGAEHFT